MSEDVFLLGAGASMDAGLPGSWELSRKLVEFDIPDNIDPADVELLRTAICSIAGALAFRNSTRGQGPFGGVDVEEMFSAAKMLSTRSSLELAPFISSWHPVINELERSEYRDTYEKARKLKNAIYRPIREALKESENSIDEFYRSLKKRFSSNGLSRVSRRGEFEDAFEQAVACAAKLPVPGAIWERVLRFMLLSLPEHLWLDPADKQQAKKVKYLLPLLKHCKKNSAPIFTLNYDNTVELCGDHFGIEYDTGMKWWHSKHSFRLENEMAVRLVKLHGSIDWSLEAQQPVEGSPIENEIVKVKKIKTLEDFNFWPALIFGEKNKLTMNGPYLTMLLAFQDALNSASRLLVVGYSFRDSHINTLITDWINGDAKRNLVVLAPNLTLEKLPFVSQANMDFLSNRIRVVSSTTKLGLTNALELKSP